MDFTLLLLLTFGAFCTASPFNGTKILASKDGTSMTVLKSDGKAVFINILGDDELSEKRKISVNITRPNLVNMFAEVDDIKDGQYQSFVLSEIFDEYKGQLNDDNYTDFLETIRRNVLNSNLLDMKFYIAIDAIDSKYDGLFSEYATIKYLEQYGFLNDEASEKSGHSKKNKLRNSEMKKNSNGHDMSDDDIMKEVIDRENMLHNALYVRRRRIDNDE